MTPCHPKNTWLLFAKDCDECRNSGLLKVLLVPKQGPCISPSKAQVTLWKRWSKECMSWKTWRRAEDALIWA